MGPAVAASWRYEPQTVFESLLCLLTLRNERGLRGCRPVPFGKSFAVASLLHTENTVPNRALAFDAFWKAENGGCTWDKWMIRMTRTVPICHIIHRKPSITQKKEM